jgi:hypothetical protein
MPSREDGFIPSIHRDNSRHRRCWPSKGRGDTLRRRGEEIGGATGTLRRGAPRKAMKADDSCEEKVTLRYAPVHSPFTPVGLMLMATVMPFKRGDQRALARR